MKIRSRAKNKQVLTYRHRVLDLLSEYLSHNYPIMTKKQRRELSQTFFRSGMAAVNTKCGDLGETANAVRAHKELLAEARRRLANSSHDAKDGVIRSSTFSRLQRIANDNWTTLRQYPNVVGFSAGRRYRNGVPTRERCVSVFVQKKIALDLLSEADRLPPRFPGGSGSIPIDVVEVGSFVRYAAPGDRIAPQTDPTDGATLGIFASDNTTNATLALTAMHATPGFNSYPPAGGVPGNVSFLVGDEGETISLGTLLRGTMDGIDAAAIQLDASQQASRFIAGIGEIKSWRALDSENDVGVPVRMRGAKSGQVMYGVIQQTAAYLPDQNVGPAIVVNINALPGDSGSALIDHEGFLLGLLIGGGSTKQFYSPIGNVFHTLSCNLY
jgi:hypothetical protein